jgi:hypothetical protein
MRGVYPDDGRRIRLLRGRYLQAAPYGDLARELITRCYPIDGRTIWIRRSFRIARMIGARPSIPYHTPRPTPSRRPTISATRRARFVAPRKLIPAHGEQIALAKG